MKLRVLFLVALVLTSIVAGYFVAVTNALPSKHTTTATESAFHGATTFSYRAALAPNPIFRTPTIGPGQGTLFLALVRTLNLSFTYQIGLTAPVDSRFGIGERVSLVAPVLNLTLNSSVRPFVEYPSATSATLQDNLTFNLTSAVRLLRNITNATGYSFTTFTVRFTAVIFTTFATRSQIAVRADAPSLNLTLVNSNYLVPGNLSVPFSGALTTSSTGADPAVAEDRAIADGGAIVVFVATGIVGVLVVRPSTFPPRAPDEEAEIRALIGPYQDAVAETLSLPHKENIVVMREWIDVVRAADMLGKPILHLKSDSEGNTRHIFYVVDGAIQYVYLHNVAPPA
ncbi:MAG TPA: DUF5305 family protein [Thermoplasmata archaeon]|nr:DUF5305 family protein [Thermoplasmata archaeon]